MNKVIDKGFRSCRFVSTIVKHPVYRCSVFVFSFFWHRCDSYKNRRPCVVSNISTVAISAGLPVAVNNPVPASQVGFQQFPCNLTLLRRRKQQTQWSWALQQWLRSFSWPYFQSVILRFSQIDWRFPFFSSQQWVKGPHKWISLGPRIS